jgi:hypothetical protein
MCENNALLLRSKRKMDKAQLARDCNFLVLTAGKTRYWKYEKNYEHSTS